MTARLSTPWGGHLQLRKAPQGKQSTHRPLDDCRRGRREKARLLPALPVWKDCAHRCSAPTRLWKRHRRGTYGEFDMTFAETLAGCVSTLAMSPDLPAGRPLTTAHNRHTPPGAFPIGTVDRPIQGFRCPRCEMLCWSCHGLLVILFDSLRCAVRDGKIVTLTTVP
jgi:hypothetical protein